MINEKLAKLYCSEDLSLIENYSAAIISDEQWHCHHRLEILPTGEVVSMQKLKDQNLYYNRPASELIFLTKKEHHSLHSNHFSEDSLNKMRMPRKKPYKTKTIRKTYNFICPICGKEYSIVLPEKVYNAGKYRKTCSQRCSNILSAQNQSNSWRESEDYKQKLRDAWKKRKEKYDAPCLGKHWKRKVAALDAQ